MVKWARAVGYVAMVINWLFPGERSGCGIGMASRHWQGEKTKEESVQGDEERERRNFPPTQAVGLGVLQTSANQPPNMEAITPIWRALKKLAIDIDMGTLLTSLSTSIVTKAIIMAIKHFWQLC